MRRALGLTIAAMLGLSACDGQGVDANQVQEVQKAGPAAPAPPPKPTPAVLSREDILFAVVRAASARASGTDDEAAQNRLDGVRFEFTIRFGCDVPASAVAAIESGRAPDPDEPETSKRGQPKGGDRQGAADHTRDSQRMRLSMQASYDSKSETLRVRAAPDVDPDDPFISAVAGPDIETVEGFWIRRPWLLSPACPAPVSAVVEPVPAREPHVAIAQFHGKNDSRVAQRADRAYEIVREEKSDTGAARGPFDLILSGRLRRLPNGKVINCIASSPDRSPRCVISAEFGQVRIERAGTNDVLGDWGAG